MYAKATRLKNPNNLTPKKLSQISKRTLVERSYILKVPIKYDISYPLMHTDIYIYVVRQVLRSI